MEDAMDRGADASGAGCEALEAHSSDGEQNRDDKCGGPRLANGGTQPMLLGRDAETAVQDRDKEGIEKYFGQEHGRLRDGHEQDDHHAEKRADNERRKTPLRIVEIDVG